MATLTLSRHILILSAQAAPAQTAAPCATEESRWDISFWVWLGPCWPKPKVYFPHHRQTGACDCTQDWGGTTRAALGYRWKLRVGLKRESAGSHRPDQPGIQGVGTQILLLSLPGLSCNLFQLSRLCFFHLLDRVDSRKTEKHTIV